MRYAFIADIHGNLPALQAVLAVLDKLAPDAIFNLGDIVGYGAEPGACLAELRRRGIPSVAGNHDFAACGKLDTHYFNREAELSVTWTQDALDQGDRAYLSALPLTRKDELFSIAHSTLFEPDAFDYILTFRDAELCFEAHDRALAFVAHSHVPGIFLMADGAIQAVADSVFVIPPGVRAIVNVGSVGQPRDCNADAAFALFDPDTLSVQFRRVPYDVEASAAAILRAGLPPLNAHRLYQGR